MKDYRSTKHHILFKTQKKSLSRPEIFATEKCADEAFWGLKSIAGMHEQLWSVMIQFKTGCQKVWKPTLAHTSVAVWHIREIFIKIWLNTPLDRFFIAWIMCCYTFFWRELRSLWIEKLLSFWFGKKVSNFRCVFCSVTMVNGSSYFRISWIFFAVRVKMF